jgi:pyruvate formate lyase activating enzyme
LIRIFQKGFNFSQDGPGNRLVYHLQGCNLRCPWCSNPEGLAVEGGTACSVDDLVAEVQRSRMMFFDGGGVTLTGGEVTLQMPAVKEFLTRLHQEGISTCIETNGISPRLPEFFPFVDHLIMDVKHHAPTRHRAVTGASNELTFKNLVAAIESGCELLLRIPLIGGFNASVEDARAFASLFSAVGVPSHAKVELLSYHEYGKEKWKSEYKVKNGFITEEILKEFKDTFDRFGLKVVTT